MKILYNFASRSRPERFIKTIENVIKMSVSDDYWILVKIDNDDQFLSNYIYEINSIDAEIDYVIGHSDSKVHAINRDIPEDGFDVLINLSDDMTFTISGFDNIIRDNMERDCLLHIEDQYAGERLITMAIMDHTYYMRDRFVYNPAYYSLYCDNEQMEIAEIRGCYKHLPVQMIQHDHYTTGGASKDALYRRNDTYHADKLIFEERKAKNFDL